MKRIAIPVVMLAFAAGAAAQQGRVGIEELRNDHKQYLGKTVTIHGEVEEVLGPRLISVSQDNLFDLFDQKVLVYVPNAVALAVREGQDITVTGTFNTFMKVNLEEELGWFEPEPDIVAEFNRQYLITATQVTAPNADVAVVWNVDKATGRPTPMMGPGAQQPGAVGTAGRGGAGEITDLAQITPDDEQMLVGRVVNLKAPVARVTGDRTFTIGSGKNQILVLVGEPLRAKGAWEQNVNAGEQVQISGLVLTVPDELPMPKLSAEEQRLIDDREVYIYATRIAK